MAATVAAVFDHQDGGPPAEGLVGQPAGDGISGNARCTAPAAPRVRAGDFAQDFSFLGAQVLADHGQAQAVKAGEGREVWCGEGRIEQRRGLSRMVSVVTSILLEGLDFSCSATCPGSGVLVLDGYTLISEEPLNF